jgi:hypothetical protein
MSSIAEKLAETIPGSAIVEVMNLRQKKPASVLYVACLSLNPVIAAALRIDGRWRISGDIDDDVWWMQKKPASGISGPWPPVPTAARMAGLF